MTNTATYEADQAAKMESLTAKFAAVIGTSDKQHPLARAAALCEMRGQEDALAKILEAAIRANALQVALKNEAERQSAGRKQETPAEPQDVLDLRKQIEDIMLSNGKPTAPIRQTKPEEPADVAAIRQQVESIMFRR